MNGKRIKDARLKLGYTLSDVAKITGYSVGYISLIERNQKQPSLSALRKIADCLEYPEVWFLMDSIDPTEDITTSKSDTPDSLKQPSGYTVFKDQRREMKMPEINTQYEIFTPSSLPEGAQPKMTGLYVVVQPGEWVAEQMISHKNMDESIFVLEGTMEACVGKKVIHLQVGDGLYVPENTLHNYFNPGPSPLVLIAHFSSLVY